LIGFVEAQVEVRFGDYDTNSTRCFSSENHGFCKDDTAAEHRYYLDRSYSYEINEELNELIVHTSNEFLAEFCHEDCEYDGDDPITVVRNADTTLILSLFNYAKAYYDLAAEALADLYEEIKFW